MEGIGRFAWLLRRLKKENAACDNALGQSGWNVKDPTQVVEEFDIKVGLASGVKEQRTPYEGHHFSDYVLLGSQPIGAGDQFCWCMHPRKHAFQGNSNRFNCKSQSELHCDFLFIGKRF